MYGWGFGKKLVFVIELAGVTTEGWLPTGIPYLVYINFQSYLTPDLIQSKTH